MADEAVEAPGGGIEGGPHRAVFTGDARTATVGEARYWARAILAAWDADQLEWELSQLLTEVVTNAVLHARTALRVVLEQDTGSGRLRCEVTDGSPVLPRMRRPSPQATTGRGLQLLERVAAAWGVQPVTRGKTVWFELDGEDGGHGGLGEDLAALLEELAGDAPSAAGRAPAPPLPGRAPAPPSPGRARARPRLTRGTAA